VDIWKKNVLENLKVRGLKFSIVGNFLTELKKLSSRDNKLAKVVELKKIKQGSRTIEELMQEFRRIVRESRHKEKLLIEKFRRGINNVIR